MAENITKSCSSFNNQRLEFLRVLIPNPFVKLRIPRKVAESLQNEPQKHATLYSPHDGKLWHVEIHREGNDIYLDKGWKEFAKALDLRTGYFVLFRYESNMVFSVKVFDNTMCLKEYVHVSSKRQIQEDLCEDTDQTVGVHCAEDNMHCSLDSSWKRQKLETSNNVKRKQGMEERGGRIDKETLKNNVDSIEVPEFERVLSKSYLHSIYIPTQTRIAIGLVSNRHLLLTNREGRLWPVKFILKNGDGYLGSGWRKFLRENNLKEGNQCSFKLVDKNVLLVDVVPKTKNCLGSFISEKASIEMRVEEIINNATGASSSSVEKEPSIQAQKEKAQKSLTRFPKIEKTIVPYNIHRNYMVLSKEFCERGDLHTPRQLILKDSDGKTWQARYSPNNGKGSLRLKEFLNDNKLKVGEKCIFKLVSRDTMLVNVMRK